MLLKEFTEQIKKRYEEELNDCIVNNFNPCCYAANWNHFKDRIVESFEQLNIDDDKRRQEGSIQLIIEMKPIVKQWLEYYGEHNEDGFYDGWIEAFWDRESPNQEDIEIYHMIRQYESLIKEGIIEIYCYFESDEIRQLFLDKWKQQYGTVYQTDVDPDIYIGQRGKVGKFYENIGEFYHPVDSPKESDRWKLVYNILQDINSQGV